MLALRFLLAALGVVNAAAALTTGDTQKSVDGRSPTTSFPGNSFDESRVNPQLEARHLTNARRLALGLPILPPHRRASRTNQARSDPSALPPSPDVPLPDVPPKDEPAAVIYTQGMIEVREGGSNALLGYVGKNYAVSGVYGITADKTSALLFVAPTSASSANLETINGPDPLNPMFGAVRGPASTDDLLSGPGAAGYCFVASTNETPVDSVAELGTSSYPTGTPTEGFVESAIWHYDAATGAITPRWVNSDMSTVGSLIYFSRRILITADKVTFDRNYGESKAIYLTFLPTA